MTPTDIRNFANNLGLTLYTWKPGDGMTRYRFFPDHHATGFCSDGEIFTARGSAEAKTWLSGFKAGHMVRP